jgi:hypothetical protein
MNRPMNQSNENLLKSSMKSMSQLSIAQGQLKKKIKNSTHLVTLD